MSCETHKKRMVTVTRVRSSQRPLFTALPADGAGIPGVGGLVPLWLCGNPISEPGGNVIRGPLPHSPSGLVFAREGVWGGEVRLPPSVSPVRLT